MARTPKSEPDAVEIERPRAVIEMPSLNADGIVVGERPEDRQHRRAVVARAGAAVEVATTTASETR